MKKKKCLNDSDEYDGANFKMSCEEHGVKLMRTVYNG